MKKTKLMLGDNIESLKKLPENSIDSVVTDPPYALNFMNKRWDSEVPSVDFWREVFRVLKPGGHILSFGGTRTYHRMVVNIEDAGFEIRDQIMWLYGSGFPKSHNIGKAVDKLQGKNVPSAIKRECDATVMSKIKYDNVEYKVENKYEGWGTALKPANEPICLARKPLSEKSVAENVLKWKTGGINVDGCRVGYANEADEKSSIPGSLNSNQKNSSFGIGEGHIHNTEGRFPANIILECLCDEVIKGEKGEIIENGGSGGIWNEGTKEPVGRTYNDKGDIHTNPMCPCYMMDEQSGISKPKKERTGRKGGTNESDFSKAISADPNFIGRWPGDNGGGSSRFFYQAKVSKAERNMGLDGFEETTTDAKGNGIDRVCMNEGCGVSMLKPELCNCESPDWRVKPKKNHHPTLKPVSLMAYLCRLITPPNGIVLDPFMGSGSTGIAARLEGFRFCGMEMDPDYFKIAETRIENWEKYKKFVK